jgi:hypothetical protein
MNQSHQRHRSPLGGLELATGYPTDLIDDLQSFFFGMLVILYKEDQQAYKFQKFVGKLFLGVPDGPNHQKFSSTSSVLVYKNLSNKICDKLAN